MLTCRWVVIRFPSNNSCHEDEVVEKDTVVDHENRVAEGDSGCIRVQLRERMHINQRQASSETNQLLFVHESKCYGLLAGSFLSLSSHLQNQLTEQPKVVLFVLDCVCSTSELHL